MIEDDFYPPGSLAGRAMHARRLPETFPGLPRGRRSLGDWWSAAVEAIENALVAAGHPRAPEVV